MSSESTTFSTPHRLHPASIIIKFGAYFAATARGLVVPFIGIFASSRESSAQYLPLIIGGAIALVGGISFIGPILHYFSTTFYIEGDALIIKSGFVWRKTRTIPLARIQNVNVERTLWHRILGAAAVKVETAAGHKAEGDLAALSVHDANKLQAFLLHGRGSTPVEEEAAKPPPIYQLSLKQILLAGALGNRALYILGSMVAVFQYEGSHQFFKPIIKYMEGLGPGLSIFFGALTFVGLILVGWIVSIIISATRFYGFRIEKNDRGLLLTHGLITQFKTIVPVGRIQAVRVAQPVLYRMLGYYELYADTAGSYDAKDAGSANKICPIIPEQGVNRIGKLLLPEFEFETLHWKQVSRKTIARHAFRYLFSFVIFLTLPLAFWLKWYALITIIPFGIFSGFAALVGYQYIGYAFSNDLLAARRGVFRKYATIIPFDRIQHYSINASLFQRWLGLTSVSVASASTGGHQIHVVDMDRESSESLRHTIDKAIQSHVGSRRGGL